MNRKAIFEKLEGWIRLYGQKRLSKESGISRQGIYRLLNEKNPRFDTLEKIASKLKIDLDLSKQLPSADEIYSSLKAYGAPVSTRPSEHPLSLEEALARGIELSRTDGFLSSMIPYVLSLNSESINLLHLISLCDTMGESKTLGYYADIANAFRPSDKLKRLADLIFDIHFRQQPLFKNTKQTESFKRLARHTNNPLAKKWKFVTIDSLDHHIERYEKWQG